MSTNPDRKLQPRKASSNRTTSQLSGVQIMFAVILAVGLLLAINFSSRIAAGQPLLVAYDRVITEIDQLSTEQAVLLEEKEYVQSNAYVEQWARDRGKMIRPGERLIIPVPAGIVPTSTPIRSETDQQFDDGIPEPEPWQLWWALFLDVPPPNP